MDDPRPNILWITSEDNGPQLGCYGDSYADTPNLDRLASRGLLYLNAWSTAPVCAPARTAIISGLYPTSTGSEHMRSQARLPSYMKLFPQLLHEAGYYCTNNAKEDYNLEKPAQVWDESSRTAHWRNRDPDQPFFAVFNIALSHEGRIRARPHEAIHDPAQVRVPAYHPDVPEVRRDWAQYYDKITEMDAQVGVRLAEIEDAGLMDDTIIFYYGDHGAGMPRSKRWPYNSGLSVPLIIHVPEKYRHLAPGDYMPGEKTERLVGFVDLAPTVLSLAGIPPPAYMQGHAFMGSFEAPEQPYLFGFRGRMDERVDMVRTVRNQRYMYIRNYMPHRIYGQFVSYMFQTRTTSIWKELYDQGELQPPLTYFWETKSAEELYDLESDPDEVRNLTGSPEHREVLEDLRRAQRRLALAIRDVGFLPESEIHGRSAGSTPYDMGHDDFRYPLREIMDMADLASSAGEGRIDELLRALGSSESAVRYWAATGLLIAGSSAFQAHGPRLREALDDESPPVRIVAAEVLGRYGDRSDLSLALPVLLQAANLEENSVYVAIMALIAIDQLDGKAKPFENRIRDLPDGHSSVIARMSSYVPRLKEKILADLR